MRQSSHLVWRLPARIAVLLLVVVPAACPLSAQQLYRALRTENFRRDPAPSAAVLATVNEGVAMRSSGVNGAWMQVTIEGWIWERSVTETTRDGHDLVVAPQAGENLRAAPNGQVVARLATGCLLDEVERRPGWVRVTRTGWIWGQSVEAVGTGAASALPSVPSSGPPPAQASSPPRGAESADVLDRAVTVDRVPLRRIPDGQPTATLGAEAPVRVLARSGEWVRVQTEGWVLESDLRPASAGVLVGVSGAEVRSRPREFEGKVLRWTVQFISIQRADELRVEIPEGQRYFLARGPLPEAGFIYVTLTEEQLAQVQALAPLSELVIVGRVRAARSQYVGNPVLDLVDLAVRKP